MHDSAWPTRALGDIATWMSGGTPSTDNPDYWCGDVPWISAASLRDFNIEDSDRRLTTLGAASGTRLAPKGATIFVVRGMSLKSEFRVGIAGRPVAFGQDCKALVPHDDIDPRYLAWAVRASAPQVLTMVDEAGHGTGRLATDLVAGHRINVPSLAEQRRIADILDAVDEQIDALERLLAKRRALRSGAIESSVPLTTEPECCETLGSLLTRIDAGWSPLCEENPPGAGRAGILRVSAVTSGKYNPTESKALLPGTAYRPDIEVRTGDLLMSRANGVRRLVGVTALVDTTPRRLMLSDKTLRLVPAPARASSKYLHLIISSTSIRRQIDALLSGSSGQNNISQAFLRALQVPSLNMAEQRTLIARIETIDDSIVADARKQAKLRSLQEALMDDLLTGRVRVPVGTGV